MASTIKELRAWLHRSHPELNRLIESTIDQTPDLRLFRSPEAKASLKPWTIDMVWNGLIDEMDNLSNSPDQSHRELYDLLLRSAIHEEQKTIQEIVDNHDKTLYVFCSTYPILSYNLLKRSSHYVFAVMGDHPNLQSLLHKVIGLPIVGERCSAYIRTKKMTAGTFWHRYKLAHYASSKETTEWLLTGFPHDQILPLFIKMVSSDAVINPHLVRHLWSKELALKDIQMIYVACNANCSDLLIPVIEQLRNGSNGSFDPNDYLQRVVDVAICHFTDLNELRKLLEVIKNIETLDNPIWQSFYARLSKTTIDQSDYHLYFSLLNSFFPFTECVRINGDINNADAVLFLECAIARKDLQLFDLMVEAGLPLESESVYAENLLSSVLHTAPLAVFRHVLSYYDYNPVELLYDACSQPYANEKANTLRWIVQNHEYEREDLLLGFSCIQENYAKINVLLEALQLSNEGRNLPFGRSYRQRQVKKND